METLLYSQCTVQARQGIIFALSNGLDMTKHSEILTHSPTCILGFWELYKLELGVGSIGLDVREGEQLGGGVCCEY